MIFVPLKHGPGPVQHALPPLRAAPRHVPGGVRLSQLLPGTVALQIRLVDHVDTVLVAEVVPGGLIGVVTGSDSVDVVSLEGADSGGHVCQADGPARLRVPLVAVDSVENNALPVQEHQAALQLEAPEAGVVGDDLGDGAVLSNQGQGHPVQSRVLVVPWPDAREPEGLAVKVLPLPPEVQRAVKKRLPVRGLDPAADLRRLAFQQEAEVKGTGETILLQPRLEPEVLQVELRLGLQVHGPKQAAEPEEILVLDPGGTGALVDLRAQAIPLLPKERGQFKLRRRKAVLGVAHKLPVEPDVQCLLRPLEADADPLAPEGWVQVEFPDVAAHGAVLPVDLRGPELRVAVPGVEGVDVLNVPIALELHVSRHLDGAEGGIVEALPPEVRRAGGGLGTPGEAPAPVQRLPQRGCPSGHLF